MNSMCTNSEAMHTIPSLFSPVTHPMRNRYRRAKRLAFGS